MTKSATAISGLVPFLLARRKAIGAGVTAFLGALGTAFADGHISASEVPGIVLTTLVATGVVHQVANLPADVVNTADNVITDVVDDVTGDTGK